MLAGRVLPRLDFYNYPVQYSDDGLNYHNESSKVLVGEKWVFVPQECFCGIIFSGVVPAENIPGYFVGMEGKRKTSGHSLEGPSSWLVFFEFSRYR
jgi:hypothetical protein